MLEQLKILAVILSSVFTLSSESPSRPLETFSLEYLGEYSVTAYCPCSVCCGSWALNRPKDEGGNEIVYTASGKIAKAGLTTGVDPDNIPYGTILFVEGMGIRVAMDTGAITGKRLDLYYDTHSEALGSGANDYPRGVWIVGRIYDGRT